MRNAILIVALFLVSAAIGQTCAGGREKKGIFDDVCANAYFLNIDTCCAETIASVADFIEIETESGWVWIPVPSDSRETLYIASETLWVGSVDTVYVLDPTSGLGGNGWLWARNTVYFCDSVGISSVDTVTGDTTTAYCSFCDSISYITWWRTVCVDGDCDTVEYDVWQVVSPAEGDTCDVLRWAAYVGEVHYHYTYCYDCDTTVYIDEVNYYDTYNYYTDFYAHYVDEDFTVQVRHGDTLYIYGDDSDGRVWVASCACLDTATNWQDSVEAVFAFGEDDTVYWGYEYIDDSYSRYSCANAEVVIPYAYNFCKALPSSGDAASVMFFGHNTYAQEVVDSIIAIYGNDDSILVDGSSFPAEFAFYCDFDTTGNFGSIVRDVSGLDCGNNNSEGDRTDKTTLAYGMRIEKKVYFGDIYDIGDLPSVTTSQPRWTITTMTDDFNPWVWIGQNGVGYYYPLDEVTTCEARGALTYVIQPYFIDYSETVEVKLAAYSCMASYLGTQAVFGLSFASDCWTLQDSIIVPPCSIMVGCAVGDTHFIQLRDDELQILPVCDTCANEFVISGILNQMSETVNTCSGIDTFDLTQNNLWLLSHMVSPMWAMAADSSDSIEITVDGDTLGIGGGIKAEWLNVDSIYTQGIVADSGNSISINQNDGTAVGEIFARNDTLFIAPTSANKTIKIGDESLIITDSTGEWGSENYIDGGLDWAFGYACSLSGGGNIGIGWGISITGDMNFSAGVFNSITATGCGILSGLNNSITFGASGTMASTIGGGEENSISGWDIGYMTIGGGYQNNISGIGSTIGGGMSNKSEGQKGVIGGGESNYSKNVYSSIPGGYANSDSSAGYSVLLGSNNLLRPASGYSIGIGYNIDLADDSTIYLKNEYIVLDGALSITDFDTLGAYLDSTTAIPDSAAVVGWGFLPVWTSGDTLFFEVGDSTWVIVRDSVFVTP